MKRFPFRIILSICSIVVLGMPAASAQEFHIFDLQLNDICYSSVNDRLYGAVPGNLATGNSIAVIEPNTGTVERYIPIGSEPNVVQISTDGRYLFIGLNGNPIVQRYDLQSNMLLPAIDLELFVPAPSDSHYPIFTGNLQSIPAAGSDLVLARRDLNSSPDFAGISVYDDTTARALTIGSGVIGGDHIVITENGQTLWGLHHAYSPTTFQRYQITAQGISAQSDYPGLITGEATHVGYQNGRIYLQNGQIFDVSGAGTPSLLKTIYSGQDFGNIRAPLVPALDSNYIYSLSDFNPNDPFNSNGYTGYRLRVYNKLDFSQLSVYPLPNDFWDTPKKMLSMGKGRVAVLSTSTKDATTTLVLFNSKPCSQEDLNLTITPSIAFPCVGDTLVLTAKAGYADYHWSNGATGQSIKISSTVTNFDSLRYRVMGGNGCLSQFSPATQVTFEARPTDLIFQLYDYKNIICPDETARILPYVGSGNAVAYVFNTGDTVLNGQELYVSSGGVYTAYAISAHGCASHAGSVEIFEAINNPGPPPVITADGPIVTCGNELVTLSAPANPWGYLWSNGATTRTVTPQWSAPFAVQTIFENGCHSKWSDTLQVVIGFSPGALVIEEDFFVLNIQNVNQVGDSVQWFRNGQAIPGATGLTYTPTQLGLYTVQNFFQGCPSLPSAVYAFAGTCEANIIAQPNAAPATEFYLIADPSPANNYTYQWSTGSTTAFITVNTQGEYCLTVTRPADGATAVHCLNIISNNRLRAGAEFDFQPIEGMPIILFKNQAGQFTQVQELETDATGQVLFDYVPPGSYVFQAVPPIGSPLALAYFPTYYWNYLLWSDATNVNLNGGLAVKEELPQLNSIRMVPTQMFSGSGTVSGLVQQLPGFGPPEGGNQEGPLAGILVYLFGPNGMPVAYTFTDINGNYYFSNLPFGYYTITINLPGIAPFSAQVVISSNKPNLEGIVFTLIAGNFSVGTKELDHPALRIWPNPTTDQLNLELEESAHLWLFNALGEQVAEWEKSAGHTTVSLQPNPPGVYWLQIRAKNGERWQEKVVKQ